MQLLTHTDLPGHSSDAIVVSRNLPPVPSKVAEEVWKKGISGHGDLLPTRLGLPEPTLGDLIAGERRKPQKKVISSPQEWVLCFNTYTAIITMKEPDRVKDLLAYASLIVKASIDYEGDAWLQYDRFFHRQAAAEPSRYPRWGEIDPSIWTQQFGRAIARLAYPDGSSSSSSSDSHNTGSPAGETRSQKPSSSKYTRSRGRPYPKPRFTPICQRWNRGDCCSPHFCNYQHVCLECFKDHQVRPQKGGNEGKGEVRKEDIRRRVFSS
jgi:hypothetical protein